MYRIEKEENGGTAIVIDGFEKGIGDSPYLGLTDASYGNLLTVPGEFSIQFPLTTASVSGATMDLPLFKATKYSSGGTVTAFFVLDARGRVFSADATAQAWTFVDAAGSTAAATEGNSGMVYWKDYLIVFRGTSTYYMAGGTGTFTDWSGTVGVISGTTHFAINSQNDAVYFCNGTKVGVLRQNAGSTFDPTDATTYTFNGAALQLPTYDSAVSLAELGVNLLVGAALNRIYTWDTFASSWNSILYLGEKFVYRMVTMNTNTFIFCSHPTILNGRGYIYITNGSQVDVFKKLPDAFNDIGGNYSPQPYWTFGDAMYHRNQLFFGAVSASGTGGVWAIDIDSKTLYRANLPSGGSSSLVKVINPVYTGGAGPTSPLGYGYFTGTGVLSTSGSMNYTTSTLGDVANIISDKIPVGSFLQKKTFTQVELKLARALTSTESIAVTAIADNTSATLGTMTSTNGIGAVFPVTVQANQWLQIQCALTPSNTTPSYLRLREIRIR